MEVPPFLTMSQAAAKQWEPRIWTSLILAFGTDLPPHTLSCLSLYPIAQVPRLRAASAVTEGRNDVDKKGLQVVKWAWIQMAGSCLSVALGQGLCL